MKARRALLLLALAFGAFAAFGSTAVRAAPVITVSCTPGPTVCARWYPNSVSVRFTVTGQVSSNGCDAALFTVEGSYERLCTAEDALGDGVSKRVQIGVDRTPPVVTAATPSRPLGAGGWLNGPFDVQFTGADAVSGLTPCSASYAGPDTGAMSLTRSCADRAGNVSAPFAFSFKYDATPPALSALRTAPGDGLVRLLWSTRDAVSVEVTRSPGLSGAASSRVFKGKASAFVDRRVRNLAAYQYQVTAVDRAGNRVTHNVAASPARRLFAPLNGARLAAPPLARWAEVPRATYYNVQVYRGDRKILSAWPRTPSLKLHRNWRFQGAAFHLTRGTYRIFVWPGFGSFAQQRYGRIVGTGRFVVTR